MENILEPLRNATIKANGKSVDVLFKCLDRLEGLIGNIVDNNCEDKNTSISDLISELKNSLTYSLNSIDCHSTNNAFYGSSDNQYSCEERCQREGLVCLGAFGGTEDVAGSSTVEINWASKIGLPVSCSDKCYAGTNSILICQCI